LIIKNNLTFLEPISVTLAASTHNIGIHSFDLTTKKKSDTFVEIKKMILAK